MGKEGVEGEAGKRVNWWLSGVRGITSTMICELYMLYIFLDEI